MSYKTGRVYKVIASQGNECYAGSTFDQLRSRLFQHKKDYKRWKEGKDRFCKVFHLFDKYGIETCTILLICEYPVNDRKQLQAYEALWIGKLRPINTDCFLSDYLHDYSKKIYRRKQE
jgi:hypothetical protein